MSAPFDRPAYGNPGGCECMKCGVIFIGAEWHSECAVCFAQGIEAGTVETEGLDAKHESAVGNADAPEPCIASPNPTTQDLTHDRCAARSTASATETAT